MKSDDKRLAYTKKLDNFMHRLPRLIVIFIVGLLVVYVFPRLGYKFTTDAEVWGAVGDFVGGLLNPFLTILTVYLLIHSLRLQSFELNNMAMELENARERHIQSLSLESERHMHSLLYESTLNVFDRRAISICELPKQQEYILTKTESSDGTEDSVYLSSSSNKIINLVLDDDKKKTLINLLARFNAELLDFAKAGHALLEMKVPSYVIRDTLIRVHPEIYIIHSNLHHLKHDGWIKESYTLYTELFKKADIDFII